MSVTERIRPALAGVPAYIAGKPAPSDAYKLSSNENPYPPLPAVQAAIAQAASQVNRYPEMTNRELIETIAAAIGVDAASITVGPGSVGVLAQLLTALCDPEDEVVFAWRSFEAYPILTKLTGAIPVMVPLTSDYRHDLAAMAAAVTPRTKAVLLCSPNNPTGPALTANEVLAFLDRVPRDVCIVIDEAYLEFGKTSLDSLALLPQYKNIVVLRTFSKAFGLAGLRIGYGVSTPKLAAAFAKTAIPFAVNGLVLAAVQASLASIEELDERVTKVADERDRVGKELKRQGWALPESQANFVYFPADVIDPATLDQACAAAGLVVRRYGDDGVRVTIAEPAANDVLLETAQMLAPDRHT